MAISTPKKYKKYRIAPFNVNTDKQDLLITALLFTITIVYKQLKINKCVIFRKFSTDVIQ